MNLKVFQMMKKNWKKLKDKKKKKRTPNKRKKKQKFKKWSKNYTKERESVILHSLVENKKVG